MDGKYLLSNERRLCLWFKRFAVLTLVWLVIAGCVCPQSRCRYLYNGLTGFFYGPLGNEQETGVELDKGFYYLISLDKSVVKVLEKLKLKHISIDIKDSSIEDFVSQLNAAQLQTTDMTNNVKISVVVHPSWNSTYVVADNQTNINGHSKGFTTTIREYFMPSVSLCFDDSSVYEILIELSKCWKVQFHFTIVGGEVVLRIAPFQWYKYGDVSPDT